MKPLIFTLFLILTNVLSFGQSNNFAVKYAFDGNYQGEITSGNEAITIENATAGGTKMGTKTFDIIEGQSILKAEIIKNNASNYNNTFLKLNIKPKVGYTIKIKSIKISHSSSVANSSQLFRIGVKPNGAIPVTTNIGESTPNTPNKTTLFESSFSPDTLTAQSNSDNYLTVWFSARGADAETFNWNINQVDVIGTYEAIALPPAQINITENKKQKLFFGIDAERLWYWRTESMGNTLADLGVKELKSSFVRVAINCAYEREEGVKVPANYDKILDMMTAMKRSNPNIQFFASPRPLDEAYTDTERQSIWNAETAPWAPVPAWIMKWVANGTEANGSTIWKIDTIYKEKFVQYYADYLNFMHTKNLKIDYLDITNEKNDITPEILIYAAQTLPTLLNPGVHMPQIIAPSSWSYEAGVEYLDKIPSNGLNAFQIAASHNTGDPGTVESFVAKANQLNKTPWNSELHKWVGINTKDQVINTEHFLNAMNGGIVGVCSWLFYGPLAGKDHTMIWSNSTSSKKSVKYEIFKKVVNNTNGGNLYETTSEQGIIASTFVKDSITVVTVLNKSNSKKINTKLNFGAKDISTSKIEITQWQSGLATEGTTTQFTPTEKNNLTYTLDSNSVYTFKITTPKAAPLDTVVVSPLGLPTSLEKNSFANTFKIFPNPAIDFIKIEATKFELKNATFIILNNIGKKVKSGKLDAENINISDLAKGIYFIKITNKAQSATQKFIKK